MNTPRISIIFPTLQQKSINNDECKYINKLYHRYEFGLQVYKVKIKYLRACMRASETEMRMDK